ncbi:MAG: MFS transporter [Acidobacteria bacterium]|nr:MFS transporter [Acidobacteriota bacterium]
MISLRDRQRWLIVALLFALSVVNYLDRQTLSVLAPTLRETLGFGTIEYSYIVAAFLAAYTIGFAVAGRVIDRVGVRVGIALALAFWSVAGMLHATAAIAGGWVMLAVCRFLLGLGESFNVPGGVKALSEWTPTRERGLSTAIFSNGFMVGAIIAPPLVSLLALRFGWQWAFLVTGLLGFIVLAVWWRFYDSPERHPRLSGTERTYILTGREAAQPGEPVSWWQTLRSPTCYSLLIARLLTDPLPYFFTFWLPEYLKSSRGFTLAMIGALGWIPFLAADVGGPGGGALSDWLVRRGLTPLQARRRAMLLAACVMPLSAIAVRTDSTGVSLALIALLLAAHSCWITNLLAASSEMVPRSRVATVVGLAGMGGSIGGVISNLLTGRVIASYGYVPVFTSLAFFHLTAFGFLAFILQRQQAGPAGRS